MQITYIYQQLLPECWTA